jgi:hypothetical protein
MSVTFHIVVDLGWDAQMRKIPRFGLPSMRATRRKHLLSRLKAGIERLLARSRRDDPLSDPLADSHPLPTQHRLCEILGDLNRRSKGPGKSA